MHFGIYPWERKTKNASKEVTLISAIFAIACILYLSPIYINELVQTVDIEVLEIQTISELSQVELTIDLYGEEPTYSTGLLGNSGTTYSVKDNGKYKYIEFGVFRGTQLIGNKITIDIDENDKFLCFKMGQGYNVVAKKNSKDWKKSNIFDTIWLKMQDPYVP